MSWEIKIDLGVDGPKCSALIGPNIAEGITGYGDSYDEAMRELAFSILKHSDPTRFAVSTDPPKQAAKD